LNKNSNYNKRNAHLHGKEAVNIALVGYGYWGTNILRNLLEIPSVKNIAVCDTRVERLNVIDHKLLDIKTSTDYKDIIINGNIGAVIIATPTASHYEIAKFALTHGKHVMLEKPMTSNSKEAQELIALATLKQLTIVVDHTFLYNGAVHFIKKHISDGKLGKLNYIDSTRINLGIYQPDVNVLWDLASHDLAIVNYLLDEKPQSVRAIGKFNSLHKNVDNAYLFLYYESGTLVQVNCSWASPVKMRQMILGGSSTMVIYDEIEPTHKLKLYDYSTTAINDDNRTDVLVDYRLGDITIPKFSNKEPLRSAIEDFIFCQNTGAEPISDAVAALDVIFLLESAELSLSQNGALIKL
jgi:predicted dehydrogenase